MDDLHIAFDYMVKGKELKFNKKGKAFLKEVYPYNKENEKWYIQAIWDIEELTILSETHSQHKGTTLDYFDWEVRNGK